MSESLKNGWARVAFGDVVRQVRDRVDPEDTDLERYVAGEHMDTDELRIRRWGFIGDGYLGPAFHMRFKPGHVLYGSRRTYLRKVAVADFEGITANTTFVIETRNPKVLLPELLPFIMQTESFHEHSIKQSKGSVNPYVNFSDLTWYEFALPPPEEQHRIAIALSAATGLVDALRHQLAMAAKLVESQIVAFEQSVAKPIAGRLKTVVARIESGKSPSGLGRPAGPGEFGVLKVSAVGDWTFVEQENKIVPAEAFAERFEVKPGDFLVTRANADPNSVGRTCLVEACRTGLMISDKTWRLVLKPEAGLDPIGVLAWTKGPSFRKHVRNQLGGTDAKNISKSRFLSAPLPAQDVGAFNEFGAKVRALRSAQLEIERRLEVSIGFSRVLAEKALSP